MLRTRGGCFGESIISICQPFLPCSCVHAGTRQVRIAGVAAFCSTIFTGLLKRSAGALGSGSAGDRLGARHAAPLDSILFSPRQPLHFSDRARRVCTEIRNRSGLEQSHCLCSQTFPHKNGFWPQKKGIVAGRRKLLRSSAPVWEDGRERAWVQFLFLGWGKLAGLP